MLFSAFGGERGIGHAMLADRSAPRALSLAREASKEKKGFERRSRSGAPLKILYILLRNPRSLVSNPALGLVGKK